MRKIISLLLAFTMSFSAMGMCADAVDSSSENTDEGIVNNDSSSIVDSSSVEESSEEDSSSQAPVEKKKISDCKITGIVNKTYTGNAIKQTVVVNDGDAKLKEGKDYSLRYSNNVNVGKASVVVTGEGEYSGSKTLTFLITAPTVSDIKNLSVSNNTTTSFTISWSKVSGATGYVIQNYHKTTKQWKTVADIKSVKYSVSRLKSASVYKCRVCAYKTVNGKKFYGKYSNADCVTVPEKIKKVTVSGLSESGYTLKWDKISGMSEYRVYVYNTKKKAYDRVATTTNNSFKVTGKKAAQRDTYVIRAIKKYNNKSYFSENFTGTYSTMPNKVQPITTKVKLDSLKISWKKVANADGYQIYYSDKKSSGYKLLKQVNNKTFSYTTKSLANKKIYIKVRAYVKTKNTVAAGTCSTPKRVKIFAKKTYNQVINGYKNSRSVTISNAQGYKISNAKKKELQNALTYLGGTASFAMLDLDSGTMVGYNANSYLGTASTVKLPYMLYALKCMEDGSPSMNTKLTYKQSDYSSGSSVIVKSKFGTKFTLKTVFHDICAYSDNCGYYMLQDYFGYTGYNKFISSLGCRTSVSPYRRWGVVSASDSTKEWIQMYNYLYNGKYGSFMRNELKKSTSSNFRIGLGGKYTVYSKCGWTDVLHHDTAVVEAEHPYVLICLTDRVNAYRLQRVARAANAIHDEMWKYYNS